MKLIVKTIVLIIVCAIFAADAVAHTRPRATGIGLRTTYWNMTGAAGIAVSHESDLHTSFDINGFGGHIFFLSRMNRSWQMEFTLGSVGAVRGESGFFDQDDVDIDAVTPITLGLRYNLIPIQAHATMLPYLSAGVGPYVISNVRVRNKWFRDEVSTSWQAHRGGYLGGGIEFPMLSWVSLNFDVKYHFIDFAVDHPYSDYEYGIGVQFMWGELHQ